jgi:pimeloyl-ACP methyl ester carboxylesterase
VLRAARFLHAFARPAASSVRASELRLEVGGAEVEASLYAPSAQRGPLPGWVVLHGITVSGRRHASLVRFAQALAASGGVVLVPDVPAWRALTLGVGAADATIAAGAQYLEARADVAPGGVGVVGFSFGATQALVAAADPALAPAIRSVVGFGGYCELHRTLAFMATGEFAWRGALRRVEVDPYGRWIMAYNYLTRIPGLERMHAAAKALGTLAREAGQAGAPSWAAEYDVLKAELRAALSRAEQRVWDVLAPPAGTALPDPDFARELARGVADAALAEHPSLDPRPILPRLRARTVLAHGRADRLVPFVETLDLAALLPPAARPYAAVTGLFAHSAGVAGPRSLARAVEGVRFVRLLDQALRPA